MLRSLPGPSPTLQPMPLATGSPAQESPAPSSAASGFFSGSSTTTTCVIPGTCAYGTVPQYDQSGVYGSIGQIAATLSGTSPSFSVSGTTGFIQTSTFATTASFSQAGGAHEIGAGSSTSVHLLLGYAQQGVPVKIQICIPLRDATQPSPTAEPSRAAQPYQDSPTAREYSLQASKSPQPSAPPPR